MTRVHEACERLGICEQRFHQLRQHVMEAGLAAMEPRSAGRPARASSPAPAAAARPRPTPRLSCPTGTGAAVQAGRPRCRTRARGNHTMERPSWTARPSTRKTAAPGPPVALWIRHPRAVQEAPSSCPHHRRITRPGTRVRPPPLKIEKTTASNEPKSVSAGTTRPECLPNSALAQILGSSRGALLGKMARVPGQPTDPSAGAVHIPGTPASDAGIV